MVHDDWPGTLVINPPDQRLCGIDGSCTYCSWVVDGTYTGATGVGRFVHGTFQGQDTNRRRAEPCPNSDHRIAFTIAFDPSNPQPFEGYVFTWEKKTLAGYTWWAGIPFGWYARKR
jgi:hypothetical protein